MRPCIPTLYGAFTIMNKRFLLTALCALALAACGKKEEAPRAPVSAAAPVNTEEKVLNIYNWPDYITQDMVANFEKETGIKVNYQTFENNEALQAKLIAGNSGYDLVVPGAVFAKSQIEAGLLRPLDKAQIPNLANLDPAIMAKLDKVDPGNTHLIPWAWSFTTVGINKAKVAKALGNTPMPENAWDLVFNPTYTSKLKSCGIAYLDSPTEIMPPACPAPASSANQHATSLVPRRTGLGRSILQRSNTFSQRGLNAQPCGMAVKRGMLPLIWARRVPVPSSVGIEPISPLV